MSLLTKAAQSARAKALGPFAAGLAPLLYCAIAATPYVDAESPALFLASVGASAHAAHAPSTLFAKLCALFPLGPLALRVSVASALAFALAARALYRSIDMLLRAQGVSHEVLLQSLALGVTLFACGTPLVLAQGSVPEAYALQLALSLLCLSRLSELEAHWPAFDLRPLYAAAVSFGLCASNDPRAAIVLLPAAIPTLSRVLNAKGSGPLLRALGFALLPCAAALVFALLTNDGSGFIMPEPVASLATLMRTFAGALGVFGVLVALGAIAALQTPGVRRIGVLWASASLAPIMLYAWLAPPAQLPHGLGMIAYVLPACAVLAAALPGALLAPDGRSQPRVGRGQLAAILLLLGVGALRMHESATQIDARQVSFLETWLARTRPRLPARALLLMRNAEHARALEALEAEDHARPDLRILALDRLDYAGSAGQLASRDPELRALLRAYLLEGTLSGSELETLAAQRPVLLDLDARTPVTLYETLRPSQLMYEVTPADVSKTEERAAATAFREDFTSLRDAARQQTDAEGARLRLSGLAWAAALYFAGIGDRDSARASVSDGQELKGPEPFLTLAAQLGDEHARGPVDVHAFVDGTLDGTLSAPDQP